MRIRILGGGWYGCHLATAMISRGHDVTLQEKATELFSGASGGNPARLHLGPHYPRSKLTRALCQEHFKAFMGSYGLLTCAVPINIYAIAAYDSVVDFGTYREVLSREIEFVTIHDPDDFGLEQVEGAILTGERHIRIDRARAFFAARLADHVEYCSMGDGMDGDWDWTLDCTFCSADATGIDRFEPCICGLLEGPTDKAVTIMDGPFPSIYPWDEDKQLSSLTSARFTPLAKCATYDEAVAVLESVDGDQIRQRMKAMREQMGAFWPESLDIYRDIGAKLSIRAMPRSGSDARLVDIVQTGPKRLRIRAGKIDAILTAEQLITESIHA